MHINLIYIKLLTAWQWGCGAGIVVLLPAFWFSFIPLFLCIVMVAKELSDVWDDVSLRLVMKLYKQMERLN